MRKYRVVEERLSKDINEKTLDLIKNCSLEQLQEMNKNR